MAVATYYFDASIAGPTDPGAAWTNDANAVDGSAVTSATGSGNGSKTSLYLEIKGTTATSTDKGVISQVRARFMDGVDYSDYGTLTDIGWTWTKVSQLETRTWWVQITDTGNMEVYQGGDSGGTALVACTLSVTSGLVSIIEIEVTYTPLDLMSKSFYLKQGFQ